MDIPKEEILKFHSKKKGKIEIRSKVPLKTQRDLSIAYTPGVAEICSEIVKNRESVYEYTSKGNMVAVVTDGTAVLGLGNIGAEAGLPVMEGKCILFKKFGNVDAFPICIGSKDPEKIIETVKMIAPSFGGINLEDIGAPNCFYIEERLKAELDIPVFHDDQHGTAIVVLAALLNALKLAGKKISEVKIVFNGAGAAGTAVSKLLISEGAKNIIMCDKKGTIYEGRKEDMNGYKEEIAKTTNRGKVAGSLKDAMKDADVFIGVSVAGAVTKEMISSMKEKAIVLAMANPTPEIMPDEAKSAGAYIVGTGRSDFPNQINNVLAFPGVFRGALNVRASRITEGMKKAAAHALASLVSEEELKPDYILPSPLDKRVVKEVGKAVAKEARKSGVARC